MLRVVGAGTLIVFALVAYTPFVSRLYERMVAPAHLQPAEAVVVLGAGVGRDGVLGDNSLRRALHGILLYRQGLAPLVIMLGPRHPAGSVEAEVRARLARDLGLPPSAVLALSRGETTREEAIVVQRELAARGLHRVLLVTGGPHMRRARALFEKAGLHVVEAPDDEVTAAVPRPEDRLALGRYLLQEAVARTYYKWAGYL